jgi:hypothetical protein
MTLAQLQAVIAIVAKYADAEKCGVFAEHDILFLPLADDAPISADDARELEALGAHKSRADDCWALFT